MQVNLEPNIQVDSVEAAYQLALAGAGIASPPRFLAQNDIKAGRLIELLPEWQQVPLSVYAVWPANTKQSSLTARLKTFLFDLAENNKR